MSAGFLSAMAQASHERVQAERRRVSLAAVRADARDTEPPPPLRLDPRGFDLIAEVKLRSPSAGELAGADDRDVASRALTYARGGAVAVSVLTEPARFGGRLAHLREAAAALRPLGVPAMRKDFLVDAYQVYEARAAGAGGVLLILRMLDDAQLASLLDAAAETGMFVLLEAFDPADLARAGEIDTAAQPLLLGLNARDLQTLEVDTDRFGRWRRGFPAGALAVAESGLREPEDFVNVARLGYRAALVGSSLMRAADPAAEVARWIAAGRGAVAC